LSQVTLFSEDQIEALHLALQKHNSIHLYIILDFNRSTRPGPTSTAQLLVPLLKHFPGRVHVSLFRSPKLSGILGKLVPPRFNEGWGTWHAKIYGADDDVMITGFDLFPSHPRISLLTLGLRNSANLNQSYFTNRQDRYIYFSSQPLLSQYCLKFMEMMSGFSYKLLPSSEAEQYELVWSDAHTHPGKIHAKAQQAFLVFQRSSVWRYHPSQPCEDSVLVVPVIQAGQFSIREEEEHLKSLFKCLAEDNRASGTQSSPPPPPWIELTSGYPSLHGPYQDHILQSHANCRITVASPKVIFLVYFRDDIDVSGMQANGFYGSKGLSGRIPEAYTLLEQRFMRAVNAAGRCWSPDSGGVQLIEWERDGWTYHAKGEPPSLTSQHTLKVKIKISLPPQASGSLPTRSPHLYCPWWDQRT
jgi:CDP-diacylglycerol---glycerol-3-phosphate 3-phosphatidyltransferase